MSATRSIYPLLNIQSQYMSRVLINPYRFPVAAGGTIAFVVGVSAGSSTGNSVPTGAVDTTGANFLAMWVAYDDFGGVPTLSDSKGNTWTALTLQSGTAVVKGRMYYCESATVGSGHTFTATGSFNYPSLSVGAFSGVKVSSAFDAEDGNGNAATNSIQPTTGITPSLNNEVVLYGLSLNNTATASNPSGYTTAGATAGDGANHIGSFLAYKIQTTAGTEQPTWTWTGVTIAACGIACFKAA